MKVEEIRVSIDGETYNMTVKAGLDDSELMDIIVENYWAPVNSFSIERADGVCVEA